MTQIDFSDKNTLKKLSRTQLTSLLMNQAEENLSLEKAFKFERKKNEALWLLKDIYSTDEFIRLFLEGLSLKKGSYARCTIFEFDFFCERISTGYGNNHSEYEYLDNQVNEQLGGKSVLFIPDTSKIHSLIFSPEKKFSRSIIAFPILVAEKKIGLVWIGDDEINAYTLAEQETLRKSINEFELSLSLLTDIKRQKQAIVSFREIFNNIDDPILIFNRDLQVTYANESAISQFNLEQIPAGFYKSNQGHFSGIDQNSEQISISNNGNEFIGSLQNISKLDSSTYKFCRLTDVTKKKNKEKYFSGIIETLSHYFKIEIDEIIGLITMAQSLGSLSQMQAEYLQKTHFIFNRLKNKIDDLLSFNRTKEDGFVNVEKVDAEKCIDSVIGIFQSAIQQKQVAINKNYKSAPVVLETDWTLLYQILLNLFESAIHDSSLSSTIEIFQGTTSNNYNFWIKDNGRGLSKPDIEAFFDNVYAERSYGNLQLARALTTILMGEFTIESSIGRGKKVIISLPIINNNKSVISPVVI